MENKYLVLVLIVVLILGVLFYKSQELKRTYQQEAKALLGSAQDQSGILSEADIQHLPQPVQKYLAYSGAVGKEKVYSLRVVCEGEFRPDPNKPWVAMRSEQYNSFAKPTRIYYMTLKMNSLPVIGVHVYKDAKATMLIKAAGLVTVGDGKGEQMNQGETVTVFNDMCLLAPATLIDKRISWETMDPLTVKATFNNSGIKVSAKLYFNELGQIVNFVSEDRYFSPSGSTYRQAPWATPVRDYQDFNGIKLASYGEAVWHFPAGDYCYGKIKIKEIEYNVKL